MQQQQQQEKPDTIIIKNNIDNADTQKMTLVKSKIMRDYSNLYKTI
jgi:hypothetical protein